MRSCALSPKGELAPVYYLYGPEDILKDEAVQAILDRALDPGLRDFNLDQRVGRAARPRGHLRPVHHAADDGGPPRRRAARASRAGSGSPRPAPHSSSTSSARPRRPSSSWCRAPPRRKRTRTSCAAHSPWRASRSRPSGPAAGCSAGRRALGVTLEDAAADHLLAATGGELGAVAAELQKLGALPAGTPLTAEQVGALVGVRHGETIYDWRDAVLDGERRQGCRDDRRRCSTSPASPAVRLVTLLGTSPRRRGAGAQPLRPTACAGGSLERLVFERIRASSGSSACPTGRPRAPAGPAGRRAGRRPECAKGCGPRATPIRRSRARPSPTSAGS